MKVKESTQSKTRWQRKPDKFSAIWLSHSSINDYLKCPRLYFLKNIWKNGAGRKVCTVSPHMSLGSAVHNTIEPLAEKKTEERFAQNLLEVYEKNWKKYSGKIGGFTDSETEENFKQRGLEMIKNIISNPGPLTNKTVKFYKGDFIPNYHISEEDNLILCGLVDWVEYIDKSDSLRVIDFKTGLNDEREDSMQLPIYKLIVENLQKRKVTGAAYWYLAREKHLRSVELIDEDIEDVKNKIIKVGREIKERKEGKINSKWKDFEKNFTCRYPDGCYSCREYELLKNYVEDTDKVEYVGKLEDGRDAFLVKKNKPEIVEEEFEEIV